MPTLMKDAADAFAGVLDRTRRTELSLAPLQTTKSDGLGMGPTIVRTAVTAHSI